MLKIVFMGTPDFALPSLKKLCDKHDVICVYTQPPRPKGRGYELTPSPVQVFAEEKGIPVRTPASLKTTDEQTAFKALGADLAVVAAYGLILPEAILTAFPLGAINVHGSLLPRWRGAAPISRAIMAGDKETGITIMQMDKGMDTGAMLLKKATPIDHKTAAELTDELALMGADLLIEALSFTPNPIPQDDALATYAPKIKKDEGALDFTGKTATELERQIRAIPSYFECGGERVKVLASEEITAKELAVDIPCKGGTFLRLTCLQRPGKKPLAYDEFLRGSPQFLTNFKLP